MMKPFLACGAAATAFLAIAGVWTLIDVPELLFGKKIQAVAANVRSLSFDQAVHCQQVYLNTWNQLIDREPKDQRSAAWKRWNAQVRDVEKNREDCAERQIELSR